MSVRISPRRASRAVGTLAALVLLAGACGGPTELTADFPTTSATVTLFALNGTAPAAPTGLALVPTPQVLRPGPDFGFDLAVDFAANGSALLYPVDRVASLAVLGPGRFVGLQLVTEVLFDSLGRAPDNDYTFDEALPVAVGDIGVVESLNHPYCRGSFFLQSIYAKFRVEAIDPVARTVRLRVVADPNCGFRGLESGLPSR